nr:InlB B-repeat-containing protein [Akkermansiaceae bacterium]
HASLDLDGSGGANVFAVFNYTGYVNRGAGLNSIVSKGALLSAGAAYGIRLSTDNTLPFKAGDGLTSNPPDVLASQDLVYSGTRDDAAMTARVHLNGNQRASRSAEVITSDNGSALVLGGETTTSRCADVRLGEVLIVRGVITNDDRQKAEGYLAHKWGMADKLPDGHPHKDEAPLGSHTFAEAALGGAATDADNDPLIIAWSVVSGPGDVTFADPSAAASSATFSRVGTYVLRLTVNDGFSTKFDEVTITVETPIVEPKTYDVYLIAGGSNADGRGDVSDLTGALAPYAGPQSGVKFCYVNPTNSDPVNPTYNTGWTTLAPGYGVSGTPGTLPATEFGFELSLGKALAAHAPDRNVAIIKVSQGGTSLHTDWNPAGGANHMWQTFANKVPEALAALTANGDTAEIRGMFWHQGESDGSNPTYQSDLAGFIAACRAFTGKPHLPFAIGELERDHVTPTVTGRTYQLTAMTNVAAADPNTFVASSEGLMTCDGTHFTSAASITFGERFAKAYHDSVGGVMLSVTYEGNGSTGGTVPIDPRNPYSSVSTATVLGAGDLVKSGHNFAGWNTAVDGSGTAYPPGSVFVITADTILHAQWTPKLTPTVDAWPVAAPITVGQPLSAATLSGGTASVPGSFAYTDPSTVPPAGILAADITFTPHDTATYNTVQGTVDVTVRTAFASWADSEEATFSGDANGDGIADGLAWLLGAAHPTEPAHALLPVANGNNGVLEASFAMLNQATRGTAVLQLQYGTDLKSWTTIPIPEASGTLGGVEFIITPNGALNTVMAAIHPSSAPDGRLFIRLSGSE